LKKISILHLHIRINREYRAWVMTHSIIGLSVLLMCFVNGLAKAETPGSSPPPPKVARRASGFYKEIFMSGGVRLSSRKRLPAADSLKLAYEYYAGKDKVKQNQLFSGNEMDFNGVLLYPDGQPRFRMIYVNGGSATVHGKSLKQTGRDALRQFYKNGGSYCGSCAGSFLSGRNTDSKLVPRLGYLHIFPFNTLNTGMKKERVGHFIPADSPLLQYRNFGNDGYVADIYHNNGNWLSVTEGDHLKHTEILATYDTPGRKPHQGAAVWAYKRNEGTGRIINIGSHPEGITSGERLDLTEACFLYALDGTGQPQVKGRLKKGVVRKMTKSTSDEEPAFTKIGDRQCHHFTIDVGREEPQIHVKLEGEPGLGFHLYLNRDSFALPDNSTHAATGAGSTKVINAKLSPGRWFVSVECASTVVADLHESKEYFVYTGKTAVLNGAAYEISMTSAPTSPRRTTQKGSHQTATKQKADDLTGPPFVSAKAWGIADGKTGKLLWGANEDVPRKSASTTKIMTAWIVMEMAKNDPKILDEIVTYSKLADQTIGSTSGILTGESLRVSECLYGLLLPSGNDAGNALAEHFNIRCLPSQDKPLPETINEKGKIVDYTTRHNFIAEMNRRAKSLGMSSTVYRLPYGDGGTPGDRTTSVCDLLKLAWTAMQNPLFRKYIATVKHEATVQTPNGKSRSVSWTNTNQLLQIEGFDGIKTGTNIGAGACLVSSGHLGDDHLIVVVLGSTSRDGRYVDSKNLYRWAWLQRGHRPPHGTRPIK
jgi:D-alanyl-D-alanine carboxypeptidase (penicillin-binding protein 5/6)